MGLWLNMIVRNEAASLPRLLQSVLPHIEGAAILDTGSTDRTKAILMEACASMGLPFQIKSGEFRNFSQARNEALAIGHAFARESREKKGASTEGDWLLLCDADMELFVRNPKWVEALADISPEVKGISAQQQCENGTLYPNIRLLRVGDPSIYIGSTHEYLAVQGKTALVADFYFRDHESGSNRDEKWERDIRLLEEELAEKPGDPRATYYLAQSHKARGGSLSEKDPEKSAEEFIKAAKLYAERADMKGDNLWPEETWSARYNEALCLLAGGQEGDFCRQALIAYAMRPTRQEPLFYLAKFFRERGAYESARMFAERGLRAGLPPEDEMLFIEGWIYAAGLAEEFYLSAIFSSDPVIREQGRVACNTLALSRAIKTESRRVASYNMFYLAQPLHDVCPSYQDRRFDPPLPEGYAQGFLSLARKEGGFFFLQRAVNYEIAYDGEGGVAFPTKDGGPIATRNFVISTDENFNIQAQEEFIKPEGIATSDKITGIEDGRIFLWQGEWWGVFVIITPEFHCRQILVRLDGRAWMLPPSPAEFAGLVPPGGARAEKNWVPVAEGDNLRFIYFCDPTVIIQGPRLDSVRMDKEPLGDFSEFRGSSQALAFDGGWLWLVHECVPNPKTKWRGYLQRFVWADAEMKIRRVSFPFFFRSKEVEVAGGLTWKDDRTLAISFHSNDNAAFIATVSAAEVFKMLREV